MNKHNTHKYYLSLDGTTTITDAMQSIEERYNKPVRAVLVELLNEHGTLQRVADELFVTYPSVAKWIRHLDIKKAPGSAMAYLHRSKRIKWE